MSMLLGSECVAQDPGGLVILGSETTYLLWSHFRFKWVCWFKTFIFGLIMAFHTGPFNKCHSFWTYETHRFSAPSGKYEQKWVCPFRIKCSISAVHFSFFGERHLFLTVLYLSPSHSWFSTLSSVCTAESQCLPQYNQIRQTVSLTWRLRHSVWFESLLHRNMMNSWWLLKYELVSWVQQIFIIWFISKDQHLSLEWTDELQMLNRAWW